MTRLDSRPQSGCFRLTPTQPLVAHRLRRGYPFFRVHVETASEEVDQEVVAGRLGRAAVDEGSHQVPAERRAAEPSSFGVSAGDDVDAALVDRPDAVARYSVRRDEVALSLTRRQKLLTRHTEHLDDTGHLVALIFAREQRIPGQQLDYDTACNAAKRS